MDELAVSGAVLAIIVIGGLLYLLFIGYTIYHLLVKNPSYSSILWLIVIIIIPFLGCIIYWIMYSRDRKKHLSHDSRREL